MMSTAFSLIIIIIILIVYNWYVYSNILCGAWSATDEFLDENELDEFIIHIDGLLTKTYKIVMMRDSRIIVREGSINFYNYSIISYIFVTSGFGRVHMENPDASVLDDILPDSMSFEFNPIKSTMRLYDSDKIYGEFVKI